MNKNILILIIFVVFAGGCFGGKSIEPSYLRIGDGIKSGSNCEKVKSHAPKMIIKRYTSLPSLDRETVIFAVGSVLNPNYRWSWEGTPAEIFDVIAGPALNCLDNYEVVTPYRPGIERSLVLSGVITSFELQQGTKDEFTVAVRYSLWDSSGKILLSRKLIDASAPVKSIDGNSLAAAANSAVESLMNKTIIWIDGLDHAQLSQK
ncbi:hypothetical protein [Maridesulfovibrio zosterae]|uniref:hypothetical protein n=1 Tax=Maridesulfovibrio zosterae TaxID=82171 RepID=UPI0003FFD174|nr:hypothetical protein [Maridesulfovibrio zosterae]